jgi:hypothetical protein
MREVHLVKMKDPLASPWIPFLRGDQEFIVCHSDEFFQLFSSVDSYTSRQVGATLRLSQVFYRQTISVILVPLHAE